MRACTPRLGFVPAVNLARCFLHRAYDALQAGNLCEAGCLLREAVRRQLLAECAWKGCLPDGASDRTAPLMLARALWKAGHCSDCGLDWTKEIITLGNRAAHCGRVDRNSLTSAIAIWHSSIDNDPCGEPSERVGHCKPVAEGYDVDDCDDGREAADWWKPDGWQFGTEGGGA